MRYFPIRLILEAVFSKSFGKHHFVICFLTPHPQHPYSYESNIKEWAYLAHNECESKRNNKQKKKDSNWLRGVRRPLVLPRHIIANLHVGQREHVGPIFEEADIRFT